MIEGYVRTIFADKGYGFIRGDDGQDYFLHHTEYRGDFQELYRLVHSVADKKNIRLQFEGTHNHKGYRAEGASLC